MLFFLKEQYKLHTTGNIKVTPLSLIMHFILLRNSLLLRVQLIFFSLYLLEIHYNKHNCTVYKIIPSHYRKDEIKFYKFIHIYLYKL